MIALSKYFAGYILKKIGYACSIYDLNIYLINSG